MELSLNSWLSKLFKMKELRREHHERRTLPVTVLNDKGKGVTRDLSTSGVYFLTDKRYEVGLTIRMMIDLENPPGTRLSCVGTVVRVEDKTPKVGIAVRLRASESKIL